jgi:hypothetical protein
MRLATDDYRSSQSNERGVQVQPSDQNLMTAARRAALDALEREFRDLLQTAAR